MSRLRFVQLPDGKVFTFAGLIEDFLFNDLKLPFSSMDCNGEFHPGTKLNAIAKEMYSRKYANVFQLKKEDWCYIDKHNRNNDEFIDQMLKMKFTTKRAVYNGEKLDCYSLEFVNAVITYLLAEAGTNHPVLIAIEAMVQPVEVMPALSYKEWSKPKTQAAPLFSITAAEEEEISGTVISTFPEQEQQVIREYIERCKNTYDARKRTREKEKCNGKTGCTN
jgi:hypothetical protein